MAKKSKIVKDEIKSLENVLLTRDNTAKYPWGFKDGSVKSALVVGLLEFVPGKDRPKFMDELYRILSDGGTASVIVPYWASMYGIQDYAYEFPPMCEISFMYFNKGWRTTNHLENRGMICDFDFTYGYAVAPDVSSRANDARSFALKNYVNSVQNLQLMLTKRAAEKSEKS